MSDHICGLCAGVFATDQAYVEHSCAKTNHTPADMDHYGERFKKVSEAAIRRGEKNKQKQN